MAGGTNEKDDAKFKERKGRNVSNVNNSSF
jgi:hypothetical protein